MIIPNSDKAISESPGPEVGGELTYLVSRAVCSIFQPVQVVKQLERVPEVIPAKFW